MDTHVNGRVVVVTGASGGIGSAIAREFAREGAKLVLHYHRNRAGADTVRKDIAPSEALLAQADLTTEAGARRLFAAAIKRFGRIDTLIANAGDWETRDVFLPDMSLRQWRRTLDGVLTSTFLCLREFLRIVKRQRQGNATLIGSTAAIFGEAGHADYAAGKAALTYGLTRSLKNELSRLAPHTRTYCGGRLNCVCPGWTAVPRLATKLGDHKAIRNINATMALPQIARPEDIARAVVFLSSDHLARHITGQVLVIAGGMEGRLLWQPNELDPAAA